MAGSVLSAALALAGGFAFLLLLAPPVEAQQGGAAVHKGQGAGRGHGKDAGQAASGTEAELRQRIERLEEQIVDMQVVMGTLESLAKSGSAASRGGGGLAGSEAARLDGLETQIRALTAQLEQIAAEVRGQGAGRRGGAGAPPPAPGQEGGIPQQAQPDLGGFGETTVKAGGEEGDAIGNLLAAEGRGRPTPPATAQTLEASVSAPSNLPVDNPKQLYETAYGYLLQQNYAAAESAFQEFLKRYPNDSFSGNAQYWLGESLFVRGQYKAAASAFLKGYETYSSSTKAPDSLLKLAMSLERLGQKEAACSSYAELSAKFPNASASIKSRAQAERQRAGCL